MYMVGDKHGERTKYAINYFEQQDYKVISIEDFESTLREISNKSKGIRPDILMLWHSNKDLEIIKNPPSIPRRIMVNWIEVFDSNFQGFPSYDDIAEAILRTITWKDLYDAELLRRGMYGEKFKTKMKLYDLLKDNTWLQINFFIIQEDLMFKCFQIEPDRYCRIVPEWFMKNNLHS